jgi:predicted DNA-binding transcriptional regulator YafY
LTKLNSGESVTIEGLSKEFNVSNRTIQRDLNERFSYLPITKENKYYHLEPYALGKLNFEDKKEDFEVLSTAEGEVFTSHSEFIELRLKYI